MAIWFTADWHLGDDRFEIMGRPFTNLFDMHKTIIQNYCAVVQPEDDVFFVGDVAYKGDSIHRLKDLPGQKYLICGNQDRQFSLQTLRKYFMEVIEEGGGITVTADGVDCYCTHYPTRSVLDRFNLVGHIHGSWKVQKNMLNVGVDAHHFRPVSSAQVAFYRQAIQNFYDEDVFCSRHQSNLVHDGRGKSGSYFPATH